MSTTLTSCYYTSKNKRGDDSYKLCSERVHEKAHEVFIDGAIKELDYLASLVSSRTAVSYPFYQWIGTRGYLDDATGDLWFVWHDGIPASSRLEPLPQHVIDKGTMFTSRIWSAHMCVMLEFSKPNHTPQIFSTECSTKLEYVCEIDRTVHCAPPNITNATIIALGTVRPVASYGTVVQIKCNNNSRLIGAAQAYCQLNGKWTTLPTCYYEACDYPTVENGVLLGNSTEIGSQMSCLCKKGFYMIGDPLITCHENATWSSVPKCQPVDCGPYSSRKGSAEGNETTFGSVLTYRCSDTRYYAVITNITCMEDGTWSETPDCHYNYADRGVSHQSSTQTDLVSQFAIDGSFSTCATTSEEVNPWWRLQFTGILYVLNVSLVNFTQSFDTHLNYLSITLLNTTGRYATSSQCGLVSEPLAEQSTVRLKCNRTVSYLARLIEISVHGHSPTSLSLCEVQVYGSLFRANLALNKPTVQSSTVGTLSSALGVDDDDATCSLLRNTSGQSWTVDLQATVDIDSVIIMVGTNISDHLIQVVNFTSEGALSHSCDPWPDKIQSRNAIQIHCLPGTIGRFVKVTRLSEGQLHLCDVKVFGARVNSDVAFRRHPVQSSSLPHHKAHYATDWSYSTYSRTFNFEIQPWWMVDLKGIYAVYGGYIYGSIQGLGLKVTNVSTTSAKHQQCVKTLHYSFMCDDHYVFGRFAYVQIQGDTATNYLQIMMLRIYGIPMEVNVALNKKVWATSYGTEGTNATKAVDGYRDCMGTTQMVATSTESNPALSIDLLEVHNIFAVSITTSYPSASGVVSLVIMTSNSSKLDNPGQICNTLNVKSFDVERVECSRDVYGRFLHVQLEGFGHLALCEVEVHGVSRAGNIAEEKATEWSSRRNTTVNCGGVDRSLSLSSSWEQNPWWRVDLVDIYGVYAAVITHGNYSTPPPINLRVSVSSDRRYYQICGNYSGEGKEGDHVTIRCERDYEFGRYVQIEAVGDLVVLSLCGVEVYGIHAARDFGDVAIQKPTKQSSTHLNFGSSLANDGNFSCHVSMSSTQVQFQPYWMVDLDTQFAIRGVTLTNAEVPFDQGGLGKFVVNVSNFSESSDAHRPCASHPEPMQPGETKYLGCEDVVYGRFVFIQKLNVTQNISICEVKIHGVLSPGKNLALFKHVDMSSGNQTSDPWDAVDGSRNTRACIQTSPLQSDPMHWVRVDLLFDHRVDGVALTSRADGLGYRLSNFTVLLEDDSGNTSVCAYHSGYFNDGETKFLRCISHMILARYVSVQLNISEAGEMLELCEVEVYGTPYRVTSNLALHKPVYQSSVDEKANPDAAVDGVHSVFFDVYRGTCAATKVEIGPWWAMDLEDIYEISSVAITTPEYAEQKSYNLQVKDFSIIISNTFTFLDTRVCVNHVLGPLSEGERHLLYCQNRTVSGRFLKILSSAQLSLTLCEVEAFGKFVAENVALYQSTSQTKTVQSPYNSSLAVDGNRLGSCTHVTPSLGQNFWMVKLAQGYFIRSVTVVGNDGGLGDYQVNASIDNVNDHICKIQKGVPADGREHHFGCDEVAANVVEIHRLAESLSDPMVLCEFEVYGRGK